MVLWEIRSRDSEPMGSPGATLSCDELFSWADDSIVRLLICYIKPEFQYVCLCIFNVLHYSNTSTHVLLFPNNITSANLHFLNRKIFYDIFPQIHEPDNLKTSKFSLIWNNRTMITMSRQQHHHQQQQQRRYPYIIKQTYRLCHTTADINTTYSFKIANVNKIQLKKPIHRVQRKLKYLNASHVEVFVVTLSCNGFWS